MSYLSRNPLLPLTHFNKLILLTFRSSPEPVLFLAFSLLHVQLFESHKSKNIIQTFEQLYEITSIFTICVSIVLNKFETKKDVRTKSSSISINLTCQIDGHF